MGKTNRKDNVRIMNKFNYYMEDMGCRRCKYYQGTKRGCKLTECCCEAEKLEAIKHGRIKREKRLERWDL
jgi:hypothetical protein